MVKRIFAFVFVVCLIVSSSAFAASWNVNGESCYGTIYPKEKVYSNLIKKATNDNYASGLTERASTNVTFWFGLRDANNKNAHKAAVKARVNASSNYIYVFQGGYTGKVKYKSGSGIVGKKYKLAMQVDTDEAKPGYLEISVFVP